MRKIILFSSLCLWLVSADIHRAFHKVEGVDRELSYSQFVPEPDSHNHNTSSIQHCEICFFSQNHKPIFDANFLEVQEVPVGVNKIEYIIEFSNSFLHLAVPPRGPPLV